MGTSLDLRRRLVAAYRSGKTATYEAAAKMFEKHPSFAHFPGEAVEIMEVLPIPGQA